MDSFKNDKIKELLKEMIHTVAEILYNDIFFYICIICIYSISSFIIILAILYCCTHTQFLRTPSPSPSPPPPYCQNCYYNNL